MTTEAIVLALIGLLLPLLSALVTRAHWPAEVAGIATLFFAAATGVITEATNGGADFRWHDVLIKAGLAFAAAAVGRLILWAGSNTDAKLLAVGSKTSKDGV